MRGRSAATIARASSSLTSADGPPGIDPGEEAAFDLPEVADAGDRALVEERFADGTRGVVCAQAVQEALLIEGFVRDDVGTELGQSGIEP